MTDSENPSRPLAISVAIVAATAIALWIVSVLFVVQIPIPDGTARIWFGSIDLSLGRGNSGPGFVAKWDATPPWYIPQWGTDLLGQYIIVPLWIPAAVFAVPGYRSLRRLYWIAPGHCRTCRYD